MGRKRMYKDIELPPETVKCVKGLMAESERQRKSGIESEIGLKVQIAMDEAQKNIEHRVAKTMIDDICAGVGYDHSRLAMFMDLSTYYRRRRRFIFDVAVALGLK